MSGADLSDMTLEEALGSEWRPGVHYGLQADKRMELMKAEIARLRKLSSCQGCDHIRTSTCHYDCRRDKSDYYLERQRPREWHKWPVGSRAYAIMGGYWERTKSGWKWCSGDTFPTPGADVSRVLFPDEVAADYAQEQGG